MAAATAVILTMLSYLVLLTIYALASPTLSLTRKLAASTASKNMSKLLTNVSDVTLTLALLSKMMSVLVRNSSCYLTADVWLAPDLMPVSIFSDNVSVDITKSSALTAFVNVTLLLMTYSNPQCSLPFPTETMLDVSNVTDWELN